MRIMIALSFPVTNGVRQGGILSPHLFTVYIDELHVKIYSQFIGCHFKFKGYNYLIHVNDTVL